MHRKNNEAMRLDQLLDRDGMHRECDGHVAGIDPPLQLRRTADATDKVDARIASDITDTQDRHQHPLRQQHVV